MFNEFEYIRRRSWNFLLRKVLLPIADYMLRQEIMNRLNFLEEAQWWDQEQLYEKRDKELQFLIKTAYHEVPFHRSLMDKAGVEPESISTEDDLQYLPITTKDMYRQDFPQRTTRRTGYKTRIAHTSGSTGKNFQVLEDTYTTGWYRASFILALQWAGWHIGEPHLQTGMSLKRGFIKGVKDFLMRSYYVSAYDLTDDHLDTMLLLLEDKNIKHLWGYPGSLYYLARRAKEVGWNQPLKSAVSWGDNLLPHYRKKITSVFQTKVFDTYGCAEGIQVAAQCDQQNYHIHTLDVIVEFVDSSGNPVSSGETGNLLLTRLHPGAMPLIRYQVGDLGIPNNEQRCSCGRSFDLMDSIQGRDTDVIITPSGNRLIVHFFTGILEYFSEIDSFQVIQEYPSEIVLRLIPTSSYTTEIGEKIITALKEKGAEDMKIYIELVDKIPLLSTGKRCFVINKLLRNNVYES